MAEKKATKKEANEGANLYEIGFLVTPFAGEDAIGKIMEELRAVVEAENGTVFSEGNLSLIKLAYPIDYKAGNKKTSHESAYFGWIQFRANGEGAEAIGKKVAAKETIIRSLLIHTEEVPPRPVRTSATSGQEGKDTEGEKNISDAQLDEAIKELVS